MIEYILSAFCGAVLFGLFYSYKKQKLISKKKKEQEIKDQDSIKKVRQELEKIKEEAMNRPPSKFLNIDYEKQIKKSKIYKYKVFILLSLAENPASLDLLLKYRPIFKNKTKQIDQEDLKLFLETIQDLESSGDIANIGEFPCADTGQITSHYLSEYSETQTI